MNKYYFNRKPKAAQTAKKRKKGLILRATQTWLRNSIEYSLFIFVCVMLCLMVMFGVYPVGK